MYIRVLSLALCIILLLSMFCGCKKNNTPEYSDVLTAEYVPGEKTAKDNSAAQDGENGSTKTNGNKNKTSKNQSSKENNSKNTSGSGSTMSDDKVTKIDLVSPNDGVTVDIANAKVREYLNCSNAATFWSGFSASYCKPNDVEVQWSGNKTTEFTVYWSENADFTNASSMKAKGSSATIKFLIPGHTYYWKVVYEDISSATRKFTVLNAPVRWMSVEGLSNMRDLGGWTTTAGKAVKYGLLYRSACIDGYKNNDCLTENGKIEMSKTLGIKTEIDLRIQGTDDGNQTKCIFGGKYEKVMIGQYDKILNNSSSVENAKKAFKQIFSVVSDEKNYPIVFHCNAGADRTGTVAFILSGVLGVPYEQLVQDYELTTFSKRTRYRSKLESGSFSADGIYQNDSGNYVAFDKFYRQILNDYGNGGTLQTAIENYLTGNTDNATLKAKSPQIPKEQIEEFRKIMLG